MFRKETARPSWFIMVLDDVCRMAHFLKTELRIKDRTAPRLKLRFSAVIPAFIALRQHVGAEIKHRGKMAFVSDKLAKFIIFHIKDLCHSKRIMFCKCILFDILKIFPDAFYFFNHFHTADKAVRSVRLIRREIQILFNIDDRVNTETCQSFVQPPVDHLIDFLSERRILPVQIGLLSGKHMKIIHVCPRHRFPCAPAKIGAVIARFFPVFSFYKMKISGIFSVWICKRFLKPFMFIRTMIDHKIHQHIHIPLLCLGEQFIKLFHCTELFRNLIIIRYIIALIHKRRLIDR